VATKRDPLAPRRALDPQGTRPGEHCRPVRTAKGKLRSQPQEGDPMRRYVFRLAILGLAVLGPSVVRGDDQQIAQQIVQKLQAEKQAGTLKGFSIDLSVEEGTVWLSGRVADEQQQAKALDIARR